MHEMKTLTLDGELFDTFVDQTAREKADGKIAAPATATVGQILRVKAVDENGKPTEWETVDMPDSGANVDQAAIEQAVADYLSKNPPVVSGSVNTVINQNGGGILKVWAGTQAEYNALLIKDEETVYLIDGATSSGDSGGNDDTVETTYGITNNLVM